MLFKSSQRSSTPLESQSSLIRVSGEWRIHGRGWDSMPTHGGVDLTIMIHWDQPNYGTASIIEHNADLGKYAGMLNLMAGIQSLKGQNDQKEI